MCISVVLRFCLFVFFFKQKTAYEMRISDWSSDVCSSDLAPFFRVGPGVEVRTTQALVQPLFFHPQPPLFSPHDQASILSTFESRRSARRRRRPGPIQANICTNRRSEEHTSELQSLMRISYAVFCLKKKTEQRHFDTNHLTFSISFAHDRL